MENFKEKIARVEAFVFDVDGVLTDNGIIPTPDGDFIRRYHAKDGYAVAYALRSGYKVCVISSGYGAMLRHRLEKWGVTRMYLNCMNKIAALEEFMRDCSLSPEQVAYVGDDIPDLDCLRAAGVPVCPSDAAPEVIEASCYVSEYEGGRGCVRDIVEQVLRSRGDWARDTRGVLPEIQPTPEA